MQRAYFFDSVESDYILKFVPRGQQAVLEIEQDTLIPLRNGTSRELLSVNRMQEIDLPKRVNVVYLNRLSNYQPATQVAERAFTESRNLFSLDLPVVLSDQVAKIIADISLYSSWISRTQYTLALPMSYSTLEPSDVIDVTDGATTHTMRITHTKYDHPGLIFVEAVAEDNSAYDFYSAPGENQGTPVAAEPVASTKMEILDIPALPADGAYESILRYAGVGYTANWRGAVVFRSDDGGGSYNRHMDIPAGCRMGTALAALPTGITTVFDEISTVNVSMYGSSEIASATELAVLNGANAALIGDEVIQFKTATLIEPGKYMLSGLLRGRLGTNHATGSHIAGERFVILDSALIKTTPPTNLLHNERLYKPVSIGTGLATTAAQAFTYRGVCYKPYSPVHIGGERDGSGNLTINWIRRTRIQGDWLDGADVPLNETSEAYEVDIYNGLNVVRTISGLGSPTANYTAADQTTDFGSPQANVSIKIYQLSSIIGRGYPASATV